VHFNDAQSINTDITWRHIHWTEHSVHTLSDETERSSVWSCRLLYSVASTLCTVYAARS